MRVVSAFSLWFLKCWTWTQPFTQWICAEVRSREELRSQGQTVVKTNVAQQLSHTALSAKRIILEITQESPPHNSHVATLKLRGPPILPWKVYKLYIGRRLKRNRSVETLCCHKHLLNVSCHYSLNPHISHNYCADRASSRRYAPCWWRLCRSSSASARVDWCCGWLRYRDRDNC